MYKILFYLDLVINLLEGVAIELKIKSFITLLEDNLNYLLWNWHSGYSTFKVPIQF